MTAAILQRPGPAPFADLIARLRAEHAAVLSGGGKAQVDRHHARGKILVRDRIDLLLDPGSPFLELSPLAAHGLYGGESRPPASSPASAWSTTRPA